MSDSTTSKDIQHQTSETLEKSDSKDAEVQLQKARGNLERVVAERTEELTAANAQLQMEIAERRQAEAAQTEHLRFERLISDLSSRFVNLPAEDIDQEIGFALQQVVEFFDVDRGTLFQISEDQKHMQAVNTYTAEGAAPVPKVSASDLFPHTWPKFLSGRPFSFATLDELPEEASRDRESFKTLGVKSNVAVPVKIGGNPKYVFSLVSTRKERAWDTELPPRIQLVAELLANALSRKHTEMELQKTELKYRTVADFTYDWEYWIDPDGKPIYVSPACERISGYTPQEFAESSSLLREIVIPEDQNRLHQHFDLAFETLKPAQIQFRIRTRDGEIKWIEHACRSVKGSDGTFLGLRASNRDITERKKSEEELKVKNSAIECSISGVAITDLEGKLIYVNDSLIEMWGFASADEVLGRFTHEFWEGDKVYRTVEELRTKGGAIGEDLGKRKDGSLFPVQFSASMIKDQAGRPLYMFGSFIDISERKQAELEISDRLRFEQLLAEISSGFVSLPTSQTDDAIVRALALVSKSLGVDRAAVFERNDEKEPLRCTHQWAEEGAPPAPEELCNFKTLKWFQDKLSEGEVVYTAAIDELPDEAEDLKSFCRSLGIRSVVEVPLLVGGIARGAAVFIAGHSPRERSKELIQRLRLIGEILASALARQHADEQLRRGEERYALASIAGRVGVWDWNLDTNEIYVDPKLKAMIGFEDHEIRNHIEDWGGRVHPGDADRVMAEATKHLEGLTPRYEVEHRMIHKNGSIRWFLARGTAIRDETGRPHRVTGTDTDITEQKLAREALADLGGRLINAQEEERGRIAREIHDDVNQRLALLAMDLELTGQSPPSSAEELGKRMIELSNRVKEISTDLHHLSYRLHPRSLERLGLSVAIKSLCREISEQQAIQIQFTEKNVPDTIPDDAALCLYRVAQESLQNVVKHSRAKDAHVTIGAETKGIHLVVSDSGVGFDTEEVRGRNGLGIVSMRERLRAIGGRLTIRSKPNEGTHIEVFVPIDVRN